MKRSVLMRFAMTAAMAASAMMISCSNLAAEKELLNVSTVQAERTAVSGTNGTIDVSGMTGSNLTVKYNAGSQKNFVRLFVSEGNGKGLVLANKDMSYSGGTYSYTLNHGTFKSGAKIYVCVLENSNGVEKCIPQGNLADCSSWKQITYGQESSGSAGSASSGSGSSSANTEAAYSLGNGTYFFIAKCSDKSLDVDAWSTNHGANIQQWTYGGNQANQEFVLRAVGDGWYTITNVYSGYSLDANDWGTTAGTNVIQWDTGSNQANQQWKFVIQGDSSFKIVNRHSGLVLDVDNASKNNGANVQLWSWNGSDAQKWFVTKLSDSMTTGTGRGQTGGSTGSVSGNGSSTGSGSLMAGATDGVSVGTSGRQFIGSGNSFSRLVWSDEFEGTALKSENWKFDTGAGGWGNSELQTYTAGSNVKVGNGVMTITAKNDLTSTRIKSAGLKDFKYGKIEARIKCDQGTGSWPAFWMLGTGANYQWPYCGEIDIMEHANSDNFVYETCHWNANGKGTNTGYNHAYWGQTTNNNYWNKISNLDVTQWHTYGIEWTPSQIRFYLDGTEVMACDIGNSANGTDAFNEPFYILFNFAMGGQFTGNYNAATFTNVPWNMYVDYVRCYQ